MIPKIVLPDETIPLTSKSKAQSARLKTLIVQTLSRVDHDDLERLLKFAVSNPKTLKAAITFFKIKQ
jgi:hypothetical protein